MAQQQGKSREEKLQSIMRAKEVMKAANNKKMNPEDVQNKMAQMEAQANDSAAMKAQQEQQMANMDEETRQKKIEESGLPDEVKQTLKENPTKQPTSADIYNSKSFDPTELQQMGMNPDASQGGDGQQQAMLSEEQQVVGGHGGGQAQGPQQVMGESPSMGNNNKQMINEAEIKNIVKEEFMRLLFNEDFKRSLMKEVKEEATKEAIRFIKEKLAKKKKRTTTRKK